MNRSGSEPFPRKLRELDRGCRYYPCHRNLEDCTWCFCLFYPCNDQSTGGRWVRSSRTSKLTWSCQDCEWIHNREVAQAILRKLSHLAKRGERVSREKLLEIRRRVLEVKKP